MPRDEIARDLDAYPLVELEPWRTTLLAAAKIVRERWQQGSMGRNGGPRCMAGAVFEAWGQDSILLPPEISAGLCAAVEGNNSNSIPDWNDKPGRTKEEVAELMERVALSGLE